MRTHSVARYRWELTPLLAVAFAGLAATLLGVVVGESSRWAFSLGIGLVLGLVWLLGTLFASRSARVAGG